MKALVYHGPGRKSWDEVPDPTVIHATDAIVQVDTTTICGTDLHILKGDVPAVTEGRILGHEGVGTVLEVGSAVTNRLRRRSRHHLVRQLLRRLHLLSQRQPVALRRRRGRIRHRMDPRSPHRRDPGRDGADPVRRQSLYLLPEQVPDEAAILLSDILPTGFEIGVQYGRVKPGDTVAVVGAGPVGLSVIATAALYGAAQIVAIDLDESRLALAKQVGARTASTPVRLIGKSRCSR